MAQNNAGQTILSNNIGQNVTSVAANSSTTNLAIGNSYTFTGTSVSTLYYNAIQISLKTDVNCTVYVDQSPDGTNWDLKIPYTLVSIQTISGKLLESSMSCNSI